MKETILNVLKKMRTNYGNNENIIFAQDSDLDVVADELITAINYNQCSVQLKEDNILPFNKWVEVNKYTKMFIYYKKDGAVFSFKEVLEKYISYTNSF